jgi:hypothetical protein
VSITVQHVNRAPVAIAKSIQTPENQKVVVTLSGSDLDGDALVFSVATTPSHGTLSGTPPNLSYTPAAGYYGPDSFTYVAKDSKLTSTAATVSITVQHVNRAPAAAGLNIQTLEDQTVAVTLSGSDSDKGTLVFTVVSGPNHGTLSGTLPNLSYTPVAGYYGTDNFTYVVSDGVVTSNPATVTVTVQAVKNPPVARNRSIQTTPNYALSILLTGQDSDHAPLSFEIITGPSHGKLTGTAPNLMYIPGSNYVGSDSFTFVVNNGELTSAPATVNISVLSRNGSGMVRRR